MRSTVYTQDSGYVLRFRPESELHVALASNAYHMETLDLARPLLGKLIWNNGESRPAGSVRLDGPADATTEEDFAERTYWSGVIYALDDHDGLLLAGEDEPAPQAILLTDFGRKIRYSLVSDISKHAVPWDVYACKASTEQSGRRHA